MIHKDKINYKENDNVYFWWFESEVNDGHLDNIGLEPLNLESDQFNLNLAKGTITNLFVREGKSCATVSSDSSLIDTTMDFIVLLDNGEDITDAEITVCEDYADAHLIPQIQDKELSNIIIDWLDEGTD